MEFYCESCETAMCLDCTEKEHREHVTVPLRDVVEQHKAALKTQLDAIHSRWALYSDGLYRNLLHRMIQLKTIHCITCQHSKHQI